MSVIESHRMVMGISRTRLFTKHVNALAATLNLDRWTMGCGDAAMGRHNHPFPAHMLLVFAIMYRRQNLAHLLTGQPNC